MTTLAAALLLTVSLSTGGHWLADRPGTIHLAWAIPEQAVDATLRWQITLDELVLAADELALDSGGGDRELTIAAPTVRVRTPLRWSYQLHAEDDGRLLTEGEQTLLIYPDPLDGLADRLTEPVMIVGRGGATLQAVFEQNELPYRHVTHASDLQLSQPRIVLVAANHLADATGPGEMLALARVARNGANVMLFEQQQIDRLFDYHLRRRPAPDQLRWQDRHPLLRGMDTVVRTSWFAPLREAWAIELPGDHEGRELAAWPAEGDSVEDTPGDALVVVRTIGEGRLVLWQVPLGDWTTDPRSRQLLVNALDYLGTRTGPTRGRQDQERQPEKASGAEDSQRRGEPQAEEDERNSR